MSAYTGRSQYRGHRSGEALQTISLRIPSGRCAEMRMPILLPPLSA